MYLNSQGKENKKLSQFVEELYKYRDKCASLLLFSVILTDKIFIFLQYKSNYEYFDLLKKENET